MDTTIHTRVTSPDSDKFGGRKILAKFFMADVPSGALNRNNGFYRLNRTSAAISINEPPFRFAPCGGYPRK